MLDVDDDEDDDDELELELLVLNPAVDVDDELDVVCPTVDDVDAVDEVDDDEDEEELDVDLSNVDVDEDELLLLDVVWPTVEVQDDDELLEELDDDCPSVDRLDGDDSVDCELQDDVVCELLVSSGAVPNTCGARIIIIDRAANPPPTIAP